MPKTKIAKSLNSLSISPAFVGVCIAIVYGLSLGGCATRDLYPGLKADRSVMVRQWTRMTAHSKFPGERGAEFSNPVFFENTLIFGNQSVGLISLYPDINQIRWVLPVPNGVMSEVAIYDDRVYFGGGDGYLYCLDAERGRVQWRYPLRNPVVSKPSFASGRVFVTTSDDTVYAFDAGTGEWIWHYRRRSSLPSTIHGASSPLIDKGEVITGLSDGYLIALNQEDGKLKWEKRLHDGNKFVDIDAHPILMGGVMYVPAYDGALYAINRDTGNTMWRYDAGGAKQIRLESTRLYLPSSDGYVYSLDRESGQEAWRFELDKGTPTQIVLTDRWVIVGSSFRYLYVLDKSNGKPVYRHDVGFDSGFWGSPVIDEDQRRVYILSGAGNLMAFEVTPQRTKTMEHAFVYPYEFFVPFKDN